MNLVHRLGIAVFALLALIACEGVAVQGDTLVTALNPGSAKAAPPAALSMVYSTNNVGEVDPCG